MGQTDKLELIDQRGLDALAVAAARLGHEAGLAHDAERWRERDRYARLANEARRASDEGISRADVRKLADEWPEWIAIKFANAIR